LNVGSGGGAAAAPAAGGAAAGGADTAEETKEEEKEEGTKYAASPSILKDHTDIIQPRRSQTRIWVSVFSTKRASSSFLSVLQMHGHGFLGATFGWSLVE
jgi:hypothetical protein